MESKKVNLGDGESDRESLVGEREIKEIIAAKLIAKRGKFWVSEKSERVERVFECKIARTETKRGFWALYLLFSHKIDSRANSLPRSS